MKNPLIVFVVFITLIYIHLDCNTPKDKDNNTKSTDSTKDEVTVAPRRLYYEDSASQMKGISVADTITYNVVVRNPEPEDEWTTECLRLTNTKALASMLFQAVYKGRLVAYNYSTDSVMSISEVKALEKEYRRNNLGKVQFVESWSLNEEKLAFSKKVIAIMLAYELYDTDNKVKGYKAGIKVYLDNPLRNKPQ